MEKSQVKVNDRVKRIGRQGCLGLVKAVKEEVVGTTGDKKDKGLLVEVQWDNGTVSYFAPEGLEVVASTETPPAS